MLHARRVITATAATAALSIAAAALPAAASAAQDSAPPQARTVCAAHTYLKERPDAIPLDTLVRGETVGVRRYSPSGQWAYGKPRGAKHNFRGSKAGWVRVADLCPKAGAAAAKAKRYTVKIRVAGGGGRGPFQVGGLANITVADTQHEGQALQLCITPAPTEQPSCRSGHTGRTIDTIAWSQPGPTKVRVAIEGGPVIVKTVQVLAG